MLMNRVTIVGVIAVAALFPAARAAAQEGAGITVDEAQVKKGKALWGSKACNGCHTIGKGKMAGPDLAHITDRRSVEWLTKWLTNTTEMLASDEIAQQLLKEYNGIRMPDMKLKEPEATALLHFIVKESEKVKKSEK
jgi:nitrite reductase (NO-forming)